MHAQGDIKIFADEMEMDFDIKIFLNEMEMEVYESCAWNDFWPVIMSEDEYELKSANGEIKKYVDDYAREMTQDILAGGNVQSREDVLADLLAKMVLEALSKKFKREKTQRIKVMLEHRQTRNLKWPVFCGATVDTHTHSATSTHFHT